MSLGCLASWAVWADKRLGVVFEMMIVFCHCPEGLIARGPGALNRICWRLKNIPRW
jgi:hypothetical protein